MAGITVTAAFVRHVLSTAEGLGLDSGELLRDAGLVGDELADVDARVPVDAYNSLFHMVAERADGPALGRAVASGFGADSLGVAGLVIAACQDAEQGAAMLDRYRPLIGSQIVPRLERREHATEAIFTHPPAVARAAPRNEAGVLSALKLMRALTGVSWRPLEVRFQHARPADVRHYDEWFGCAIRFGCSDTSLVLPREAGYHGFVRPDLALATYLSSHANRLLERVSGGGSFGERVRAVLVEALRTGRFSAFRVARSLGVTERTLQRYLRSEGTSFADLLERTRRDVASLYLEEPTLSITEIAYLLGYTEPSAFYRWFRKWARTTPASFRKKLALAS